MGPSKTLFIDAQYLRDNTIINDNVDAKVLQPIIRKTQYIRIQQAIGTPLTKKLIDLIDNMLVTPITGDYKELLEDYVIPTLTEYTVYESIDFMAYKFRNKGIMTQSSDNATPATPEELISLKQNILDTAQFCSERLRVYLCENSSKFPEYTAPSDDLHPNKQTYFSGIHIPKRGCRRYGYDNYYGEGGYYGNY